MSSRYKNKDENIEDLINRVCTSFANKIESKIDKQMSKLDDRLSDLDNSLKSLNKIVVNNRKSLETLEAKNDSLDQYNKKNNLKFIGLKENDPEDTVSEILDFINDILKVPCVKNDIDSAYRVGDNKVEHKSRPRSVLVRFVTNIKRNEIYQTKKSLKNSDVSIFEDLTKTRFDLLQAAKKKYGKFKAWSSGGKIFVWDERNGKKRLVDTESEL